ncbi:uncharacterized protein TNCV_89711 [Trichonephila clavipes]|nr:uncharacterized protein TNCV_89711 [Trichonephila clavipes]
MMWAAEWNEVVFTDESRICLQHHDRRIRVWRHRGERMLNSCVMHHHTGMGRYWISLSHSSSTYCRYFKQTALHLQVLEPVRGVRALPSGLGHRHISTG